MRSARHGSGVIAAGPITAIHPVANLQLPLDLTGQRPAAAVHILFVHPRVVSERPKVVIEALDKGLIVFPGVGDEDSRIARLAHPHE
jgi:hypothetical protein